MKTLTPFFLNSKILVAMEALGFDMLNIIKICLPLLIYFNIYSEFPFIIYNCIWVYNYYK